MIRDQSPIRMSGPPHAMMYGQSAQQFPAGLPQPGQTILSPNLR